MLAQFIQSLIKDYELGDMNLASTDPGAYVLPLDEGISINIIEMPPGFLFKADVAPYPKARGELFATDAMVANLFGQGTRLGVLGLSPDGATLKLSRLVDYPVEYKEFKGMLEDFISVVDYWRSEASKTK